ncbi:DUF3967 domain-containing protein [Bacillus cereus]|nr:DUF3967 domain-containing protein [Bacillus cereus]MBT0792652.1 DUF3967 domain-containing protein [Bacillus cereus]MBX9158813.1 DUF3967 domain-containing protein [Bacillus cereus]TKH97452.1 DUF3967 domain-containing protein [Bacillus cereus]
MFTRISAQPHDNLMKMVREIQHAKHTIVSA